MLLLLSLLLFVVCIHLAHHHFLRNTQQLKNKINRFQDDLKKAEKSSLSPQAFFEREIEEKTRTPKYSQYNAEGLPTHDAQGQELSKSQAKNVAKQHQQQKKAYDEHLKKLEATPDYIQRLRDEIQALQQQVAQLEAQLNQP